MGTESFTRFDQPPVHVGSGISAPRAIRIEFDDEADLPVDLHVELVLEGSRYVVDKLTATRKPGGVAITGEVIRSIPVQTIIRGAVADWASLRQDNGKANFIGGQIVLSADDRARLAAEGPTNDTLRWAARFYLVAQLMGEPPTKAVRDGLGVPLSTAGLWVRRAKDKGYMDPEGT